MLPKYMKPTSDEFQKFADKLNFVQAALTGHQSRCSNSGIGGLLNARNRSAADFSRGIGHYTLKLLNIGEGWGLKVHQNALILICNEGPYQMRVDSRKQEHLDKTIKLRTNRSEHYN